VEAWRTARWCVGRLGLGIEPELYCCCDLRRLGFAAFCGRLILVLLHGFYRGFAERRRAGDNRDLTDVAIGSHFRSDADISGDEISHGVGGIDGLGGAD
jgi:hypothetical protein